RAAVDRYRAAIVIDDVSGATGISLARAELLHVGTVHAQREGARGKPYGTGCVPSHRPANMRKSRNRVRATREAIGASVVATQSVRRPCPKHAGPVEHERGYRAVHDLRVFCVRREGAALVPRDAAAQRPDPE